MLRIWCLPKKQKKTNTCQDRMIEDGREQIDKKKHSFTSSKSWTSCKCTFGASQHWLTELLLQKQLQSFHAVVFLPSWLEESRAPGRGLNAGHLTNPSQLSCHVRFVSPLTVSLCPDQVCTICSTALISLQSKLSAFVDISHEIPQAHTRPLHTHTLTKGTEASKP